MGHSLPSQLPSAPPVSCSTSTTAVVYCSQCGGAFGRGTTGFSHCSDHSLAARFSAMVEQDLRPRWRAAAKERAEADRAARAARALRSPAAPSPAQTVDDYLARLARYDNTAYLSDDRSIARAGMEEREALRQMAKRFDPDLTAWRKAEGARW